MGLVSLIGLYTIDDNVCMNSCIIFVNFVKINNPFELSLKGLLIICFIDFVRTLMLFATYQIFF